jgi:hypothetical protein
LSLGPRETDILTASAAFPPIFNMSVPCFEHIELSLATAPSFPGAIPPCDPSSRSENSKGDVEALGKCVTIKRSDKTARNPSLIGCSMMLEILDRFLC